MNIAPGAAAQSSLLLPFCLIALSGCFNPTLVPAPEDEDFVAPEDEGDQAVFSEISLRIEASEYLAPLTVQPADPTGAAPLTIHQTGVTITVNDGSYEQQVDGLEMIADGIPLEVSSNAVSPPTFTAQYYPEGDGYRRTVVLQFRYQGSSTSLVLPQLDSEIIAPAQDEEHPAEEPLEVLWASAVSSLPGRAEVQTRRYNETGTQACAAGFELSTVTSDRATFKPLARAFGEPPPCSAEVSIILSEDTAPDTPFAAVSLHRSVARSVQFMVQ